MRTWSKVQASPVTRESVARCFACSWRHTGRGSAAEARSHAEDNPGHTAWHTMTEQRHYYRIASIDGPGSARAELPDRPVW